MYPYLDRRVADLVKRTNAIRLNEKLRLVTPFKYLTFSIHMESAAILEATAAHCYESMVGRGVSDDARGSPANELLALMGPDKRIRGGRVAGSLARLAA